MNGPIKAAIAVYLGIGLAGCATTGEARYVYQDGEFGVVAIPQNTSRWPTFYRDRAEALMQRHFPEGYEVVRAEEVVEGTRTVVLDAKRTAELEPQLASAMLKLAKVGGTSARQQSDSIKIKECRIVYRRADPSRADLFDPDRPVDYAPDPAYTPTAYLDPNAQARREQAGGPAVAAKPEAAAKSEAGPKAEGTARQASATADPPAR